MKINEAHVALSVALRSLLAQAFSRTRILFILFLSRKIQGSGSLACTAAAPRIGLPSMPSMAACVGQRFLKCLDCDCFVERVTTSQVVAD